MNLRQAIVDFHQVLPGYLTIVDGITGMEGMGPAEGMPVSMKIILAGENPVAVDATAARVMGFDPEKIRYLEYAVQAGLGPVARDQIEVCGCRVEEVLKPFAPAEPKSMSFERVTIREEPSELKCVGCRAVVAIALNRIRNAGQLSRFAGMKLVLNNVPGEEIVLKDGDHLRVCGQLYKRLSGSLCRVRRLEGRVHFVQGMCVRRDRRWRRPCGKLMGWTNSIWKISAALNVCEK